MKKFIFSLIFLVSTLFGLGQNVQNFFDSNFQLTDNSNIHSLNVNGESQLITSPSAIEKIFFIKLLNGYDSISFDYTTNTGINSHFKIDNVVLAGGAFSKKLSGIDTIVKFSIKTSGGGPTNAEAIFTNIKIYKTNTVGIKNLEQRQLNLFTYNNKIKVNGQIDEKLTLNVFNILGQLVIQTDLKNEIETNVATGVYILQVLDEHDNNIETKKVLLQN